MPTDVYLLNHGYEGLMNSLFGAVSACIEVGDPSTVRDAIDKALAACEEAFCRADRRAYRTWAVAISTENTEVWEPCDAWYDTCDCDIDDACLNCAWIDEFIKG